MPEIHRHADARAFLARVEPWLLRAEVAHAVLLGNAQHARADDSHYERPVYWATIEEDGEILGCAYRTPPYHVGVTKLPPEAIAPLVADLERTYAAVSGFSGPEPTVSDAARAWTERRGGAWTIRTRQHLLSLAATPAGGVQGTLRLAGRDDTALAQSWGAAASLDSGLTGLDGHFCVRLLGAKRLFFWVDDQPRCMLGVLRETQTSVALGIVYTPAAFRGKGHATAAVTALKALLIERGVQEHYLYIDPANDAAEGLARKLGCTVVQETADIDWRAA